MRTLIQLRSASLKPAEAPTHPRLIAMDDAGLSDVLDLFHTEIVESCRQKAGKAPSLEATREKLAA